MTKARTRTQKRYNTGDKTIKTLLKKLKDAGLA